MINTSKIRQSIRWPAAALITLLLIACGGGNSPAPDNLTPSGQDNGTVVTPTGGHPYLATTTTTTDTTSGKSTTTLLLIDSHTNAVARKVTLDGDEWRVVRFVTRKSINLETLETGEDGYRAVYYIQAGKVFRQDFDQTPLPPAKQISKIDTACALGINDFDINGVELTTVSTINAASECPAYSQWAIDNQFRVEPSMTSTEAAMPMSMRYLGGIYDTTDSSTPSAFAFYDPDEDAIVSYSKNLQTRLQTIFSNPDNDFINYRQFLWFDKASGSHLILDDRKLYTATFSQNKLNITGTVRSSTDNRSVKEVVPNLDRTFVVFDNDVIEQFVDASTPTKHVATIQTNGAPLVKWSRQGNKLIATSFRYQTDPVALVFYSLNLSNGEVETVGTYNRIANECFFTLEGDQAWVFTCPQNQDSKLQSLIKRSLKTQAIEPIVTDVMIVGVIAPYKNNAYKMGYLVYCRPVEGRDDCANAPLLSRDMSTNQEVEIGTYRADPKWLSSTARSDEDASSGRFVLRTVNQTSATTNHSVAWTFDPSQANSLIKVSIPD